MKKMILSCVFAMMFFVSCVSVQKGSTPSEPSLKDLSKPEENYFKAIDGQYYYFYEIWNKNIDGIVTSGSINTQKSPKTVILGTIQFQPEFIEINTDGYTYRLQQDAKLPFIDGTETYFNQGTWISTTWNGVVLSGMINASKSPKTISFQNHLFSWSKAEVFLAYFPDKSLNWFGQASVLDNGPVPLQWIDGVSRKTTYIWRTKNGFVSEAAYISDGTVSIQGKQIPNNMGFIAKATEKGITIKSIGRNYTGLERDGQNIDVELLAADNSIYNFDCSTDGVILDPDNQKVLSGKTVNSVISIDGKAIHVKSAVFSFKDGIVHFSEIVN